MSAVGNLAEADDGVLVPEVARKTVEALPAGEWPDLMEDPWDIDGRDMEDEWDVPELVLPAQAVPGVAERMRATATHATFGFGCRLNMTTSVGVYGRAMQDVDGERGSRAGGPCDMNAQPFTFPVSRVVAAPSWPNA